MKNVYFGFGMNCGDGITPAAAMERGGTVLAAFAVAGSLRHQVGTVKEMTVLWEAAQDDAITASDPGCALDSARNVVEVWKDSEDRLFSRAGRIADRKLTWSSEAQEYDHGLGPAVAMNDSGVVVAVHRTRRSGKHELFYRVGELQTANGRVKWLTDKSAEYKSGNAPAVAIDNAGTVVAVHEAAADSGKTGLYARVGVRNGTKISFGDTAKFADKGSRPGVALTGDGLVIVAWSHENKLWQRLGRVNGKRIEWLAGAAQYDSGSDPALAATADLALQVHQHPSGQSLRFSTSLIANRFQWMTDRTGLLLDRTLRKLVLPASHDAGMYNSSLNPAQNQNLDIYEQLAYGIRWFDLRPVWDDSEHRFVIYHNVFAGPSLEQVLGDAFRFLETRTESGTSHLETFVLKLSHFGNLPDQYYRRLVDLVRKALDGYLVLQSRARGLRLADLTYGQLVDRGPSVIVVVDDPRAVDETMKADWIWFYRDTDSTEDLANGQLRVDDRYSKTVYASRMVKDQGKNFAQYAGRCVANLDVPCELFLLSWTLTPLSDGIEISTWALAQSANRLLGDWVAKARIPNTHNEQITNLLYVDYVETARVTDIAIRLNERLGKGQGPVVTGN